MMNIEKEIENLAERKINEKFSKESPNFIKSIGEQVAKDLQSYRKIELVFANGNKKKITDLLHSSFPEVMSYIESGINLILVGPAGSGKTHIATQVAEALDMEHFSISVNEQTSKTDFLGYVDANGNLVRTNFRNAYENGGMFIIDELDAGNPNILTVINSALSNDFCPFPDGMVKRNEKFLCVCTANTYGEGESVQYIGRNILDSATKDRFATLFVGYDTTIEKNIHSGAFELIHQLREFFKKNGQQFVISTRGIQRLSRLVSVKETVNENDVINCLNLHSIADATIRNLINKYISYVNAK